MNSFPRISKIRHASLLIAAALAQIVMAQEAGPPRAAAESTEQKVQRLASAVTQVQAQMSAYQKQLQDLVEQLAALRQQMALEKGNSTSTPPQTATDVDSAASALAAAVDDLRERQAIEASQIETHELSKVETASKYPLKVSGLVLLNGFVNTHQVDTAADPTYAVPGAGSTGFSMRQTVLGLDAEGPHPFGSTTHADVRVDFFSSGSQTGYATGLLRLRTAHATLNWQNTQVFFELDRPLLSPHAPTTLVSSAQPEFAWSGNLWTWNPQVGVSQKIPLTHATRLELQGALIDAADPHFPGSGGGGSPGGVAVSQTERSRWPGSEARLAFAAGGAGVGPEIGLSGYFSPHETSDSYRFDGWAASIDLRLPLSRHFEMTASTYRGAALGSLGGGGYSNYVYQYSGPSETARALDDVGGWTQLKAKISERLEFNGGYGIDNPFAGEIGASLYENQLSAYSGLTRNRSAFGNVIYSPSSYFLLSLEYRRLWTNYVTSPASLNDGVGIGAGYRF